MAVLELDTQLQDAVAEEQASSTSLAGRAIELLQIAAGAKPDDPDSAVEERSIWQPDSWLMQSSWQALADQGAGEEALTVAVLQEMRNPLAVVQALYRVAQRTKEYPALRPLVAQELLDMHVKLFGAWVVSDETRQTERLLLAAASAVAIGDEPLALACLERLDQIDRGWDRVILRAESRALLAETISVVGLHPLTSYLISTSIRRHEEAGAQFLHQIVSRLEPHGDNADMPRRSVRLLQKCVETFQYATLTSLNSRRLAAVAFGQAGMIDEALSQVTTMANVQDARRETGMSSSFIDPHFLRQVTRPNANPDVDFQVYTLQEAIDVMPVRQITREERIMLADRVAELAVQSDGWTAAGATSTLVGLGALKYAVDVVDYIAPTDPTRSEGVISLVRALLAVGNVEQAREQVDKALEWLSSNAGRNPERATIWGVAEAYLDNAQPEMALYLLQQRQEGPTFGDRLRRLMRSGWTDDTLRDNRIRLRALLERDEVWTEELQELYEQLCQWAPVLLEGEALISFYLDGMLTPLLEAGRTEQVVALLPLLAEGLAGSTGDKHAVHVQKAANLLTELLIDQPSVQDISDETPDALAAPDEPAEPDEHTTPIDKSSEDEPDVLITSEEEGSVESKSDGSPPAEVVEALQEFLVTLWADDANRGLWQTVHGVEGSMPLLFGLEGPPALVAIAESAANEGGLWLQ